MSLQQSLLDLFITLMKISKLNKKDCHTKEQFDELTN